MPIELIVTDLDGTVLDEENRIPESVSQAFRMARARGVPTVIATGRTLIEAVDAQNALAATEFSITMNGAFVFDHVNQKALSQAHIPRKTVLTIIQLLESYGDVFFHAYGNNQPICSEKTIRNIQLSGVGPAYVAMYNATQKVVPDLIPFITETDQTINKFFITTQHTDHLELIKQYANQIPGIRCLQSLPRGIEIIPDTVDKAHAVNLLCQHLGIDIANVLLIGDSENDIGMLGLGGVSVVMGNAPDHVKAHADWIAPANTQNGAAFAVERYVLSRPELESA